MYVVRISWQIYLQRLCQEIILHNYFYFTFKSRICVGDMKHINNGSVEQKRLFVLHNIIRQILRASMCETCVSGRQRSMTRIIYFATVRTLRKVKQIIRKFAIGTIIMRNTCKSVFIHPMLLSLVLQHCICSRTYTI